MSINSESPTVARHGARLGRLRSRVVAGATLIVDRAGRFSISSNSQLELPPHRLGNRTRLHDLASVYLMERRRATPGALDYLILVPTLRCNLACSYCQVSRADKRASGYDWSDDTLAAVLETIACLTEKSVKIEFQGGEPTLRPDLIKDVIAAVPSGVEASFVICTNLQEIDEDVLEIYDRDDVSISTSLDGPLETHARQRSDRERTERFRENLRFVIDRYGSGKVSALPTIDPQNLPRPADLVDAYREFGFTSIFLRPINYQGFARKNHRSSQEIGQAWARYHRSFVEYLIDFNWKNQTEFIEESYFSTLLRRIFRPGSDRHVDLRNPNPMGLDYVVIDYDGTAYPTDEARMLNRSKVIDLSIGDVFNGWDTDRRDTLNAHSTLDGDPDCEQCVYQAYCGRDLIDDISRYGTITKRRLETESCRRHLSLFDLAFELINSEDEAVRYSLGRWLGLPGSLPHVASVS